jgi:hypothetical protein
MEMAQEIEEKMQMVLDMCVCRSCPSWVDCGESIGYCSPSIGKSRCITDEKGCICGGCPITAELGLKHTYFCIKGSEKEQSRT